MTTTSCFKVTESTDPNGAGFAAPRGDGLAVWRIPGLARSMRARPPAGTAGERARMIR
ncbi:hypothetical protein SAMN05216276_101594 [Streptosporangium subroseum]|uniref:Uncharacterized protein n=1 Tax=Streptosporangium subroseum TaxID=106412 RepID=A0A239H5A1_9ACTN|nr:hypothetical protein [Streptosporangium subroseum]SNS76325.1 hypothetical protein SAMN05216276_101594 [Streptosporangium subroseum]